MQDGPGVNLKRKVKLEQVDDDDNGAPTGNGTKPFKKKKVKLEKDGAEDEIDLDLDGPKIDDSAKRPQLRRGLAVRFSIPASQTTPAVFSFRKLLKEQHPEAEASEVKREAPELLAAASSEPLEPALPSRAQSREPPSLLDSVGHRDPLSALIRDMESRLARQGMLGAPSSILGKHAKKARSSDYREQFYDGDDPFIDDTELEPFIDCDAGGDGLNEGACEQEAEEDFMEVDTSKFLLKAPGEPISGTEAEESDPEGETNDGLGAADGRPWRQQLVELSSMVQWGEAGGGLSGVPAPSLEELRVVLTECFEALEQSAQQDNTAGTPEDIIVRLLERLPSVAHPVAAEPNLGWWPSQKDPSGDRLLHVDPRGDLRFRDGPAMVAWTPVEESAWAALIWNGAQMAMKSLRRAPAFIRLWLRVAREPQNEALQKARTTAMQVIKCSMNAEVSNQLQIAVHRWNGRHDCSGDVEEVQGDNGQDADQSSEPLLLKKSTAAIKAKCMEALQPLSEGLQMLQRCWLKQRFWGEQRREKRLNVLYRYRLGNQTILRFACHVASLLQQELKLALPIEMIAEHFRPSSPDNEKLKEKMKQKMMLVKLPLEIHIPFGETKLWAVLHSVKTLSNVKIVATASKREYQSMDDCARALVAHAKHATPNVSLKGKSAVFQTLKHGGWGLFKFTRKVAGEERTLSLMQLVNAGANKKVPVFQLPDGSSVDALPGISLSTSIQQKRTTSNTTDLKRRQEFLKSLKVDSWVSCFSSKKGKAAGVWCNARITQIKPAATQEGQKKYPLGQFTADVEYVDSVCESGVSTRFLKPPKIWKQTDKVLVLLDNDKWARGTVEAVHMHEDISQVQFEVCVTEKSKASRCMTVGLAKLRDDGDASATWRSQNKTNGDPSQQSKKTQPNVGKAKATCVDGKLKMMKVMKPKARGPQLEQGTSVKFQDGRVWKRGTVTEVCGGNVHVKTGGGVQSNGPAQIISVERSKVSIVPQRELGVKGEGITIDVEDDVD